jgi:membrane-bound lytic murein transglycosylase D
MRKRFLGALITLQLIIPGLIVAQNLQQAASLQSPQESVQAVTGVADARTDELRDQALNALIARAEQHFQRGEAEYRQGNLTKAREEFDRAVDVILDAKVDVRNIPQLLNYYRRLIERINTYQADSIARGQGFSEQKYEVSLLDQLADVKLDDDDLKASQDETIQAELDFPFELTPEVRQFIHYFTNNRRGRATMEHGLRRSGRYLDLAQKTFREEGVPLDLVWLAQAESNWRAEARSRKAAQGIWQFVSFTGAKYGLRQNAWLDERSGIEQPTRAAARYLKFLYDRYLDWQLALAAYNCGEGAVDRAIAASGYADFWYLHRNRLLPGETRNYVPIIMAIIIVAKNPEKHGFFVESEPSLTFERVTVEGPLDLRLIAEAAGAPLSVVQDMNPELRRGLIPAGAEHTVRVPVGTGEAFEELIARIPTDRRAYWRVHQVAAGETIAEIAERHRLTSQEIARVNELDGEAELTTGDRLLIPSKTPRVSVNTFTGVELARRTYTRTTIKARQGDTIAKIAARYGVSASELARMNRLSVNSKLRAGQQIVLNLPNKSSNQRSTRRVNNPQPSKSKAKPSANKAQSPRRVTHQVRAGDTLTHIANRYGVSVTELRRWNQLPSNRLKAGQALVVYR